MFTEVKPFHAIEFENLWFELSGNINNKEKLLILRDQEYQYIILKWMNQKNCWKIYLDEYKLLESKGNYLRKFGFILWEDLHDQTGSNQ